MKSLFGTFDILKYRDCVDYRDIGFDLPLSPIGVCVFGYDYVSRVWGRDIRGETIVAYRYHRGEFTNSASISPILRMYGFMVYFLPAIIQLEEGYLQFFPITK